MLDKNIDWGTLREGEEKHKLMTKLAEDMMAIHQRKGLPNYTMHDNTLPPEGMFPVPDRLIGIYDTDDNVKGDPRQLMLLREYTNDTEQAAWVRDVHGLDYCHVKMQVQPCGMVVDNHRDRNGPLYENYKRDHGEFGTQDLRKILHFLTDWHMGQVIMLGDQCVTGWKAGQALEFPWYMEHATANANRNHQRQLLFIAGVLKQNRTSQ